MALFRCTRSGNTLSLNRQDDIDRIRQQENYTEILHESKETRPQEIPNENAHETGQVLKKRGRGRQKQGH